MLSVAGEEFFPRAKETKHFSAGSFIPWIIKVKKGAAWD